MKDLCVDFDGVIHRYTSGWKGVTVIPDDPVPGALTWLRDIQQHSEYRVHIYSSRSKERNGIAAMQSWLMMHGFSKEEVEALCWPTQKPAAYLTIDDRAICFRGTFPSFLEMDSFKPWTAGRSAVTGHLTKNDAPSAKQDWDHLVWDDCAIEFRQERSFESDKDGYEVAVLDNDGLVIKCWVYLMEWSGPVTSAINKKDVGMLVRTLIDCQQLEERPGFKLREETDVG